MSKKLHAIVVDDSELAAKIAAMHLKSAGLDVRIAVTIEELKQVAATFSPDVVLSDLNMPGVPADRICEFLREEAPIGQAAIWIMSGIDPDELRAKAEQLGAEGCVSKSLGSDEMARELSQLKHALKHRS